MIPCSVSKIISDIKIVHLETNSNSLIGYFSSLIFADNKYIIFRSEKRILIFDGYGSYLNTIDATGNGSGEYANIINAYFDAIKEYIYIIDYNDINIYNIQGDFIKSIILPLSPGGIYKMNNGKMVVVYKQLYDMENRDMLSILDTSFNICYTFKSRNLDICKDINQNLFYAGTPYEINESLFFLEPFVNTIYEIIDTTLIPHWFIDMKEIGFKTKDGINTYNYNKALDDKIPPIGLIETEKYFFIDYVYSQAKYYCIYSKAIKEFVFHKKYTKDNFTIEEIPIFGLNNDIVEYAPLFWPQYTNGKIAVSVINPVALSDHQLEKFGCKKNDNPILFFGILE